MSDTEFIRPRWQRLLVNRFVLTPLIFVLVAGIWDFYASTHDHGIVKGMVVDAAGKPVPGARVTLWTYDFTTFSETSHTASGANGSFAFTDNRSHRIEVSAAKPDVGSSGRVPINLYFRSEDTTLSKPLVLAGNGSRETGTSQ